MTELEIGQRLHNRLVKEGGFVWSHNDGTKTVHFNRGKKPTAELVAALKKYRKQLASFVDHKHHRLDQGWRRSIPPQQCTDKPKSKDNHTRGGERA